MSELYQEADYGEMKREMQALRKKIEELEAGQARLNSAHRVARAPQILGRWNWLSLPVIVAVLLTLGALGAQSKPDALFIDQNGNIGINQTKPEAPLDVNGTAIFRGPLQANSALDVNGNTALRGQLQAKGIIPPASQPLPDNSGVVIGDSDIYFSNTAHEHTGQGNRQGFAAIENDSKSYNALMIFGRNRSGKCCERTVALFDKLGIATANPQAALDVKGEIRGKLWRSEEYVFDQGESDNNNTVEKDITMTKSRSLRMLSYGYKRQILGQGRTWGNSGR